MNFKGLVSRRACVALAIAFDLLCAAGARADCSQWDLSGVWIFHQSNGFNTYFDLTQTGNALGGRGSYCATCTSQPAVSDTYANIVGTRDGNKFKFVARWSNGAVGQYKGRVTSADGTIKGSTSDLWHPDVAANWYGDRAAKCLDAVQPSAPAPPPKKVVKLGKRHPPPVTAPTLASPAAKTATAEAATDVYPANDGKSTRQCAMSPGDKGSFIETKDGEPDWVHLSNITGECNGIQGWVWNGGSLSIQ